MILGKTIHYRSAPEGLAVNRKERIRLNAVRTGKTHGPKAYRQLMAIAEEAETIELTD